MAKTATAAERRYMGLVAARGCCICNRLGYDVSGMQAIIHHRIHGRFANMRASNYLTIPLCLMHHAVDYKTSVHYFNEEQFLEHYGFTERDLIIECQAALSKHIPAKERIEEYESCE